MPDYNALLHLNDFYLFYHIDYVGGETSSVHLIEEIHHCTNGAASRMTYYTFYNFVAPKI